MHDEPTVGELVRRIEDVKRDCREETREARQLIDTKVSMERYQLEQLHRESVHLALADRVKAIEEAREQELIRRQREEQRLADRRASDRRLIFTAIVAPVLMLFLQLYMSARQQG